MWLAWPRRPGLGKVLSDSITPFSYSPREVNALAEFGAVEALPLLREALRRLKAHASWPPWRMQNPTRRYLAVSAAIRKLEARASLPRAATAKVDVDMLPRAAKEPGPSSKTLPRGPCAVRLGPAFPNPDMSAKEPE